MKTKYGYTIEAEPYSDIIIYNESGAVVCAFTKNDVAKILRYSTITVQMTPSRKTAYMSFAKNRA